jgi:pyridoxamine 5'-phosphate oxidase
MADDPDLLFDAWFAEAQASEPNDPDAVALATATTDGRPSVRMVLMKQHDARGFTFHTNLDSRKGGEIAANPSASMLFHWKTLRRQVRVEGRIEPVSEDEADAYYATRSRGSQLSAWASDQSRPLASREAFVERYADVTARFEGGPVPRPPRWSGLRLVPERIEFWRDREYRMHERRLFVRSDVGWTESLLYP